VPGNETNLAIDRLLDGFKGNRRFIDQYWPESSRRVLMMLSDARSRLSPQSSEVLDIGCGNGYISSLFAMHDFKVTATDSWAIQERDAMFKAQGIECFESNFERSTTVQEYRRRIISIGAARRSLRARSETIRERGRVGA
jgi:2-polyprenyl-3-methyl-5-hydroxy-6-metoxy-1,4-benzoquinol methylase